MMLPLRRLPWDGAIGTVEGTFILGCPRTEWGSIMLIAAEGDGTWPECRRSLE
jgi:hypothetical protein